MQLETCTGVETIGTEDPEAFSVHCSSNSLADNVALDHSFKCDSTTICHLLARIALLARSLCEVRFHLASWQVTSR